MQPIERGEGFVIRQGKAPSVPNADWGQMDPQHQETPLAGKGGTRRAEI